MLLQQVVVVMLLVIRPLLLANAGSAAICCVEGIPDIEAAAVGDHGDAGDLDCWSHDDNEDDENGDTGDLNCWSHGHSNDLGGCCWSFVDVELSYINR